MVLGNLGLGRAGTSSGQNLQQDCAPPRPCPACGGLQCLCRPRFFAGQLLTEEDLNRLETYIIEKNRLHNRYLHGWGVVCGLKVRCHPCPGYVTITSGYAISPCGDDIIVCNDDTINLCDLIQKYKDQCRRQAQCDPPRYDANPECEEDDGEWLLMIRYVERPSRGVTPLMNPGTPAPCGCAKCNCGGSSSCGCGCHHGSNGSGKTMTSSATSAASRRATPRQCEPTLICEGYVYEVCKVPRQTQTNPDDPTRPPGTGTGFTPNPALDSAQHGQMAVQMLAGMQPYFAEMPDLPQNAEMQQMRQWGSDFKARLLNYLSDFPCRDDAAYADLAAYQVPDPADGQSAGMYKMAVLNSAASVIRPYLSREICQRLLPDCPPPAQNACVCLARIQVRTSGSTCYIRDICNISCRRFVVTFPNLGYWLNLTPYLRILRLILERICCGRRSSVVGRITNSIRSVLGRSAAISTVGGPGGAAVGINTGGTTTLKSPDTTKQFAGLLWQTLANRPRQVDTDTLFLGGIGATDEEGQPFMTQEELQNPIEFLLLNQLVTPVLRGLIPERLSDHIAQTFASGDLPASTGGDFAAGGGFVARRAAPTDELSAMREEMESLQRMVRDQQAAIEELRRNV